MDNKITKKRLSDFFAYEWLVIVAAIVIAILFLEIVYSFFQVGVTPGQYFKFYLDQNIATARTTDFYEEVLAKDVFSYDVLKLDCEELIEDYSVLNVRLSMAEGDVIITDKQDVEKLSKTKNVRAKAIVDGNPVYPIEKLLLDAQNYLVENFFSDEYANSNLGWQEYTKDKLDGEKIKQVFLQRMKGDNRFRSQEQKDEGIKQEQKRIEQLCKEVCDFGKFLDYAKTQNPDLLYIYTKYQQAYDISIEENSALEQANSKQLLDIEINNNRADIVYGINIGNLSGGKKTMSEYFTLIGQDNAKEIVLMVFNLRSAQPHLQYETISFINAVIRKCSNILN